MVKSHSIVYMYHVYVSIHQWIDIEVILISLLRWIVWCYTYQFEHLISFPLDITPVIGLLDNIKIPVLVFWGNSILLSTVTILIWTLIDSEQEFILHPNPHFLSFIFLINSWYNWSEISHYDFDLHFCDDLWCWIFFSDAC